MASATVQQTTDSNFSKDVLDSDVPVLVDFWATWCGPCRAIAPHLDTVASQYAGQAKVVKVDVDENPTIAAQYGIRSIPSLLLFKGGKVVDHIVGNPGSARPLNDMVARNL